MDEAKPELESALEAESVSALEQVLDALWRPPAPSGRGRPARTHRGAVVTAAIARADRDGLEDLSMRGIAADLGVGVMSLYAHVANREVLIALMFDHCYGEIGPQLAARTGEHWQTAARRQADTLWGLHLRHPWTLERSERLPPGPHVLAMREAIYTTFLDLGLTPLQTARAAIALRALVGGLARNASTEQRQTRRSGISTERYWASMLPGLWQRYDAEHRFPTMSRLWHDGAFSDDGRVEGVFDAAVSAYLDGLTGWKHPRAD